MFILCFLGVVALTIATPLLLVEDEDGQQYYLTPMETRQRRDVQGFGGGSATGHQRGGSVGYTNEKGGGAKVGYGHANGQGHGASIDGRVPVWSNDKTSVVVGAGTSHSFGGPGGHQNTDNRGYLGVNHHW